MSGHVPVMLDEVVTVLAPRDGGVYLDGTFGGGGYASAILEQADCTLWAIDRDPEAIARGAKLEEQFKATIDDIALKSDKNGDTATVHISRLALLVLFAAWCVCSLTDPLSPAGLSAVWQPRQRALPGLIRFDSFRLLWTLWQSKQRSSRWYIVL